MSYLFSELSMEKYGVMILDNTNTILSEFATWGILYGILFMIGYIKLTNYFSNKIVEKIMVLLVFIILFTGEKMTFSPIVFILMFYGYRIKEIKRR